MREGKTAAIVGNIFIKIAALSLVATVLTVCTARRGVYTTRAASD